MEQRRNDIDRGKPKGSEKLTCPSATLSTIKLSWTALGTNPGLRGEKPVTNRLSFGTAVNRSYYTTVQVIGHNHHTAFHFFACMNNIKMGSVSTNNSHFQVDFVQS
jgi:hypothetical protein